jgi:molybdate transport system substrate-binding protein
MRVTWRWVTLLLVASSVGACASAAETIPTTPPVTTRPPKPTTIPPPPVTFDEMKGAITVYAAASLIGAFDDVAASFADAYPEAFAVVTYDSSAAIAADES